MERENDSDDNAEEVPPIESFNIDLPDIIEINDIQSEDYETLLDVTEEWGMRRRLNEANEEDMREQRQLRGLLEIDTREDRTDLVTINPKEAECIIEDFNEIEFGKELLMDLNEESISNKLYTAWNRLIPCLYNWPLAATGKIDRGVDRNIDKLITPLKILMSGNPDWQNDWKSLCSPNKRTVCGKMFKTDGIVYQCWTCSTDPTTVLCSECFMHSEHRNHSYRMASSGGGGFCDCGDVESWVSFPHCSIHKPDDSDSTGRCSDEIKSRIRTVIGAVFRICVEALSWTNFEALPSYITDSREEYDRIFATVVLNDEIHSYMEVTTCLSSTLEVSRSQAYDLANMIDKEGRTTVCVGKRSRCINMKKYIDVTMSVSRLPPILTVVIPTMLLSYQEFCIDVLHQIQKWIAESEIIREAFCIAASEPRECDRSLLESILLLDDVLWKSSRALLHKILVNCFLEPEWKIVFSNAYIKNYPEIIKQYLNSKDESLSFAELSVQLLTTPSIAAHLLINKDALKVISDTFLAELQDYKREDGNISFDNLSVSKVYRLRKTLRILADIRYILSAPSPSTDINEIGKGVISGSTSIVLILTTMQGMNSCRRATLIHVQNEPEWETAFNITMRMIASIRLLLGYTKRTSNLAIQFLNQITYALAIEAGAHRAWEVANLLNHQANCIKYDILQDPVSVHYPLSRLLVGALLNCLDHSDIKSIISKFGCLHPVWIFEHSLRVRVLTSQSIASLWKRNGLSLHDQLVLISSSRCRAEMADRDIMALQVGAAVLDPNEFLLHVMNRYKILTWLSEESLYAHRGSYDNYTYKQLALIVEEFFDLIFQILLERYHPSIGFSDWQTMLQRDMIHSLCCKNQAHNELFKDIDDPDDRKNFDNFTQTFDEILNEIAEVRKSGPSKVQYILKSEYEAMLNPYSAHLSRADRNHAEQIQMDKRKARILPLFLPIPLPPLFRPSFAPVIHILDCDLMLKVIKLILSRCHETPDHQTVTEGMLRKVCHMIMLILDEERRGISEKLTNYVRFITNLNNELVGDIKDLAYKLVAQDHSMIEPLKPLLSHIVSTIHSLTKYIETADDQYTLHKTDDLMLASLSFQEQKQVLAKKKRKELAEARKAKVLAKMNKMKESFIKANQELYDQTVVQKDLSNIDESSCRASEAPETKKPRSGDIVLIGEDCSELQYPNRVITCILCQESRDVNQPGPLMGLLCFRQLSKFLNTDCSNDEQSGVYFSTCGHTMHYKCYQKLHDPSPRANWSNILVANYGYRSYLCLDASDQETLCPFCNTLCNIFVPFWPESTEMPVIESCDTDFGKWLESSLDACRAVNMDDQFRDRSSFLSPVGLFDTEDETLIKNFFDSCDASQHKVQPHLSWNQQIYHINSFIYTVRCNIAAIEADNQNIYSDISDQTLNLLEQLVILAIIHPGTNLKWSKHQNLRRYMEGICDGINSENDLLESLVSLSAVFANQPSASFIRCGFRHRVQSFVFKFVLARNYLNIRSMIESGELSMQLNNCTFSMISDPKESLMFEKNFYFLRLCAFFYRSIFRLQFSNRLKQAKMNTDQEYIALCEYLGLDNHFFDYKDLLSTVEQHICAPRTSKYTLLITNPIKLIDLPYDYLSLLSLAAKPVSSDMIMSKSLFDDDTEESRLTFLCLHCGDVLLSDIKIRQMRSGQMGCAVSHMLNCSGYCGIFIKIKDCMVVMLQLIKGSTPLKVRGAMASAPYVDQYGDTDDGLKRGYPLFLNQPLLQKLRQTWYRQNVPHESSRYAHTHRIAFSLYWENF